MYYVTTSISTVGFGDYKSYMDDSGEWAIEMSYMIFVIMFGILLFSSVTNEVLNYRQLKTITSLTQERVFDTKIFLSELDAGNGLVRIDQDIEEKTLKHI